MIIECQNTMLTWHNTKLKLDVALASKIAKENGKLTPLQVVERLSSGRHVATWSHVYRKVET